MTGQRFICWLYGPAGQADRANIEGKVVTLTNSGTWPSIDLGGGATGTIEEANAKGVMQADGTTPVSGDHHNRRDPAERERLLDRREVHLRRVQLRHRRRQRR